MVKQVAQHEPSEQAKRRKIQGPDLVTNASGRLLNIVEPLLQSGSLTTGGCVSGQRGSGNSGQQALLNRVFLPACKKCSFHSCNGFANGVDDIRQRVSPWCWADVKKLLHRRCVHSLSVQHGGDGNRVLLRGFLHVPHEDIEICSCNGTTNATRVALAAAAAHGKSAGAGHHAANPDAPITENAGGGGGSVSAEAIISSVGGETEAAATGAVAAPGTCGPADRSSHIVEVLLSVDDGSLLACSSSCCGVGYDALQSQLCPAVAAVMMAARVASGAEVLCEHDLATLGGPVTSNTKEGKVPPQPSAVDAGTTLGSSGEASGASATKTSGSGSARGYQAWAWAPEELGFGPPPAARVLAAASGGALVLGPGYVDPPLPLSVSALPGPGLPLGLQRELEHPKRTPECIKQHLIPSSRPSGPVLFAAAGPSTAPPPPVAAPPPVLLPHLPMLPRAEAGSAGRANARHPGGYSYIHSSSAYPSATARSQFAGWYREWAPVLVNMDRYRETYRMLLPPDPEVVLAVDKIAGAAGGFRGQSHRGGGQSYRGGGRALHARVPSVGGFSRPAVQVSPPNWSFGDASGEVNLESSKAESVLEYISSRAAERGPVWHARMALLTSYATLEGVIWSSSVSHVGNQTTIQVNTTDPPDTWPAVVLCAFDEACCPVGQPAGSQGPAGALCGLLRVMWLCLHVWELDLGLARRAKAVLQAICRLLVVSELPAYLRIAAARLLGAWRLKLGDAAAHSRRTDYGASKDAVLADVLSRLTQAYVLARDGWDAPHVVAALGFGPQPSLEPSPSGSMPMPAESGSHMGSRDGGVAHSPSERVGVAAAVVISPAYTGGKAVAGRAVTAGCSSVPELQPTWLGFRPANQAAMRRLQQQTALARLAEVGATGAGGGGGISAVPGLLGSLVTGGEAVSGTGVAAPAMSFMPYAPPPLQGVVAMSAPATQEVAERLYFLGYLGLDGPYVSLAAVAGEWAKAIKMLLRRGSKADVERACRLAVERLSSPAAKAQQACFLLSQVLAPVATAAISPAQKQEASEVGGAMEATADYTGAERPSAASAAAALAAAGPNGVDSLVVSAVTKLPPTFVVGCAGRMLMSAVRAALRIRAGPEADSLLAIPTFELSFLRASPAAASDAVSPEAALLAAIGPSMGLGPGGARPSPYIALLRSVITLVAVNQAQEWRAEQEALRDLGLLDEDGAGGGSVGGSGDTGYVDEGVGGSEPGLAVTPQETSQSSLDSMTSLSTVVTRTASQTARGAELGCDCDVCCQELRDRQSILGKEAPPGSLQFVRLRSEDLCFVTDPVALAAFTRVFPLVEARGGALDVIRVQSLAVQVVRSVFRPMLEVLADVRERPRTPDDFTSLLVSVETSMAGLCDECMPERVQMQAVLEGVTVALCALYSCHHLVGASPSALGRVVTDLLAVGQRALAGQVAACQLALSRSADSLAHALEVAVAGGEEAQAEVALQLLRSAATEPPPETGLPMAVAAAVAAGRAAMGELRGVGDLGPRLPFLDDSDEEDNDEYPMESSQFSEEDELEDMGPYGARYPAASLRGFPYGDDVYAERTLRRAQREWLGRQHIRQDMEEDHYMLQAMLEVGRVVEAARPAPVMERRPDHEGLGGAEDYDNDIQDSVPSHTHVSNHVNSARSAGGAHAGGDESDVDTEELMAGIRRGGGDGEVDRPTAMEIDLELPMDAEGEDPQHARVGAEKGKGSAVAHRSAADGLGTQSAAQAGSEDGGRGGGLGGESSGGSNLRRLQLETRESPLHDGSDGGGGDEGGGGPGPSRAAASGGGSDLAVKTRHELALLLVGCSSHMLSRRLMKLDGEQTLFSLAQYIRGRGGSSQLVAPLMAGAVACLDQHLLSMPSNSSMLAFTSTMASSSAAPLRHGGRLEMRAAEGPTLKGLPAASWPAFLSARMFRYATERDGAGQLRDIVVSMEAQNPLVLTAWVCAAFSGPTDLPGRRRVLAAMALAASRRYGPSLAHLGLALARAGLRESAMAVAARALAATAADYSSFTHCRTTSHVSFPPLGHLAWYAACLLELAPVFVDVLQTVMARQQQQPAPGSEYNLGTGVNDSAAGTPARGGDAKAEAEAAEVAAAVEAEAEGRGVGEWRLPRMEASAARAAVAGLAVTLLLLHRKLPCCLLGCGEAVTAVMALLSRVATRNNVKHEQLFEGGSAGPEGLMGRVPGVSATQGTLQHWVVAAMRECLLEPLRSAPRDVQQNFVTAVAAMSDNELDLKMKIPLLEWARGARVPVSTIFDAASRAVMSATRSLEQEAADERMQLATVRAEIMALSRAMAPLQLALMSPAARLLLPSHVLGRATALGLQDHSDVVALLRELDRAMAVARGEGGMEVWIEDKCNPPSWAAAQLTGRACGPQGGLLITSGHRSWVWHVLKWVGERLLEEMSSNRLTEAGPELGPTVAGGSGNEGGRGRRSRGSSSGNGDTSHGTCGSSAPAGGTGSTDPQVMLWQLVQRTGSFRGPELLPLACTLLEVVAHEGPSSPFMERARELLSRAVLPEAGRAASLATNDAWRSAEYRLGLRRVLEHWRGNREAAGASLPEQQLTASGRPRRVAAARTICAGSGGTVGGLNYPVTDELAERVALTLVLSEGSVLSLRTASAVFDLTRTAGSVSSSAAASSTASPTVGGGVRMASRAAGGSTAAATAAAESACQSRLELRVPVQLPFEEVAGGLLLGTPGLQPFELLRLRASVGWGAAAGGSKGGGGSRAGTVMALDLSTVNSVAALAAGSSRGRGGATTAAASYRYPDPPDIGLVDEDWEDRGQSAAAVMSAASGWVMETLLLHGAMRQVLMLGAMELPAEDPRAAAVMRFLQVQAAPPAQALATAVAPLGTAVSSASAVSGGRSGDPAGAVSGNTGDSNGGAGGSMNGAASSSVSHSYSPRYSAAVWRLVLQLMRRDPILLATWRTACSDMDVLHAALQVGTRALPPSVSSRSLTRTRRMEAPAVAALSSLKQPHVRCAVTMLRVWVGSRWLLGTCKPPPPPPRPHEFILGVVGGGGDAFAAGGGGVVDDIPLEEKEPAVALLVDDVMRLYNQSPELVLDCIKDNPSKYPPALTQQHQQQGGSQGGATLGMGPPIPGSVSGPPPGRSEAALLARFAGGVGGVAGSVSGVSGASGGPGQGRGQYAVGSYGGGAVPVLGGGSALLSGDEVGCLNRLEGFAAVLEDHVRSDPAAKKVLSILQPQLPQLDQKLLRFLHKNRAVGGATRPALAAKLVRDFNAAELNAMRQLHLPWPPGPAGNKRLRAAELADWIVEHQAEYLEQQGSVMGYRRVNNDFLVF